MDVGLCVTESMEGNVFDIKLSFISKFAGAFE